MRIFNFSKKEKEVYINAWDKYYTKEEREINLKNISIYEYFENICFNNLNEVAIRYIDESITYKELLKRIDICARALSCYGVREGDVVTICMPNTPEAVISFYAVNKIGAISSMLHPLSSQEEIRHSLVKTKSVLLIALNSIYDNINNIIDDTKVYKTILVSPKISMSKLMGFLYTITSEVKLKLPKSNEQFIHWNVFYERGKNYDKNTFVRRKLEDDAVYLQSGGTTGIPKHIVLSNKNINVLMEQAKIIFPDVKKGDSVLAILPMFHCFGLNVSICGPLCLGITVILIPKFDAKRFDKLIRKYNPTILFGVPTLFEAFIKNPYMINIDLKNIKHIVSGGDTMVKEKNIAFNNFMKEHGSSAKLIQGYGMTEVAGPCSFSIAKLDKIGSVGIPLPGVNIKIFDSKTMEEMAPGEIGEIFISGPNVMSKYLNNKKETNDTLIKDEKSNYWVKSGDMGYMDEDGALFFVQRIKRMIISSGYNVYPSFIEEVLNKHPKIELTGVIGVPHPYKVEVPKAFIVLKNNIEKNKDTKKEIIEYCKKNLSKYMIPYKIEFRDKLPKTMVGKIDYRTLEKEENSN